MKSFVLIATLLVSFVASAAELKVLEVPANEFYDMISTYTRFEVNRAQKTAGVSLTVTRQYGWGDAQTTVTESFEEIVPELSLVDDVLKLTIDGKEIDCGVMGVTRIFKRPVLKLNGNCVTKTKWVKRDMHVFIVTK